MKTIKIFLILALVSINLYSQDSCSVKFNADIVSRYIDKGQNCGGETPHIQPNLNITYNKLDLGIWGSYGLSNDYREINIYGKKSYFKIYLL